MATEREKVRALMTLGKAVFDRNNLIVTDFEDTKAFQIEREFSQGQTGVLIQFSISHHALGKIATADTCKALDVLFGLDSSDS